MRLLRSTLSLLAIVAAAAEPGMVRIPGGEFTRGRSHALPDDDLKWYPTIMKDDRPARKIRIDEFWLDEREVSNEEYAAFVKATGHRAPHHWPKGVLPPEIAKVSVVNVSWDDAAAFAKWAGKRLPTEAEWERACRGNAEGKKYPWGDDKPAASSARFNTVSGPAAGCGFAKNDFGLCDMAGNVWEWAADWYEKDYYAAAPEANPRGPESGMYRVLRGGSWADEAKYLTCAHRSWARPKERSPNIGFRCAKDSR
jgi:formylglycine-generating enzyme required for sulfatase activity